MLKIVLLSVISSAFAYYGDDSRKDIYEIQNEKLLKMSRSIAIQVSRKDIQGSLFSSKVEVQSWPLSDQVLCKDEKFASQPSFRATVQSSCTAFLISDRHLLTAGDCHVTMHTCFNDFYRWVFDYHQMDKSAYPDSFTKSNVYRCKNVVKTIVDPSTSISYSIIELKKSVSGRSPLKVNLKNDLSLDTKFFAMGFMQSTPLKVASDVKVMKQNTTNFITNSDIAGENQGTLLVNENTYEVEGILVHGKSDLFSSDKGCMKSFEHDESDAYELAIKTSAIKELKDIIN
ncbi:MAG: hypothetical protein N4A33_07690 [Bacteriovoracaceae bacterium]|jgi:hypothetical protein|nr:hypothetical protein [Bacteriovoracaceae bacterium]